MTNRLRLTFVLILSGFVSNAQDSASILFIGNSYTYYNDLPLMVQELAASQGDILYYNSQLAGGATFQYHASNSTTYNKINSQPWDFVALQAQSQEPSFPDSQVNNETLPYAVQMADSVYSNRFCSEVLFFMTWGRENGDPQWGPISTFEGMNSRLKSAYMRFADSVQGSVSPVGSAWAFVRETYPSINLYSGDGSHPSLEGSYLAACTFYASVFRKTPVGAAYISTLDPIVAGNLQTAAAITVLDSLDQWNLRPVSEHTQAGFQFAINGSTVSFQNGSTKAQFYTWDFGDGGVSNDLDPSHTYVSNGTYTVTLIAESECDVDSVAFELVIGDVNIDELSDECKLALISDGIYELITDQALDKVVVHSMDGKQILQKKKTIINLLNEPKGVYLIRIISEEFNTTWRVVR